MSNLSVCGIDCSICKYVTENGCTGCRENEGKIFWGKGSQCELYKCCIEKGHENCGFCKEFPCEKLKEWASGKNPERIQNLIEYNKINT